jgi:preprotein translocase subunit SecF
MINLVAKKWWFLIFSFIIIIPGLIFILLGGIRPSIDFTGGSTWEIFFDKDRLPALTEVQETMVKADVEYISQLQAKPDPTLPEKALLDLRDNQRFEAIAQESDNGLIIVRTGEVRADTDEKEAIIAALSSKYQASNGLDPDVSITTTGPTVANEITTRSVMAVGLVSMGILFYLAWAFRKLQNPWRYGLCAVFSMVHDVFIVLGFFAILGYFFQVEIDALFVTALLTVIGFSVHDTIVVFDRVRENQLRNPGEGFGSVVNHSLVQTLARSFNTSLTTVMMLAALYLFGGVTIRNFVLALLIGITSGTYSSIFNASMLLVIWQEYAEKRRAKTKVKRTVSYSN